MENENKYEVPLKDLVHYIARKWRGILVCAFVVAILFGAARLVRGVMTFGIQKETFQKMVDIYESEYETYLESMDNASAEAEELRTIIEECEEYNDNSVLMYHFTKIKLKLF